MPRMRRTVVPDYPHHILQRGHNGQEVFKDEEDYLKYLTDLRELKEKWHVKVYGWCLLPEQVHMLVCLLYTSPSPRDVEESRMPSSA